LALFNECIIYESVTAIPSLYAFIFEMKILPSSAPETIKLKSGIIFSLVIGAECS
jgi:hypothetical protein